MSAPSDRSVPVNVADSPDGRVRFESLCLPYKSDLFRFVFWLCRNRTLAEDVMQETLVRAWRSIDALDDVNAVRSWLFTIARRELARTFERKRLETVDLATVVESGDPSLGMSDTTEIDEMRAALLKLDDGYREPLVLQVLFGYSTEEIASQMDLSVPAVLTRLYRARHQLRKRLLGEAIDESETDELP